MCIDEVGDAMLVTSVALVRDLQGVPNMQTVSSFPTRDNGSESKDKAKGLRQRIDESVEALAKAVDDIRASETFKEY